MVGLCALGRAGMEVPCLAIVTTKFRRDPQSEPRATPATGAQCLLGATRLVVVVWAVSLFAVEVGRLIVKLVAPGVTAPSKAELILSSVEIVDLILPAVPLLGRRRPLRAVRR
jgi:hypothetical protein